MAKVSPTPGAASLVSPAVSGSNMSLYMSASGIVCDVVDEAKLAMEEEAAKTAKQLSFLTTVRELYKEDNVDAFSDLELLKYLSLNKGHVGKAMSSLAETLSWRKSYGLDTDPAFGDSSTEFDDLEASGKAQFFGKAKDGTPVCIINLSRHKAPKDNAAREKEIRYIFYVMEKARREGILMDKMTVVVDRGQSGQADSAIIKAAVPLLQKHYPERLARMVIFPTNTWFWMFWKVAKVFIDPSTVTKVATIFLSFSTLKIELKDGPSALEPYINSDQLFERYGGLHKDPFDYPIHQDEPEAQSGKPSLTSSPPSSPHDKTEETALETGKSSSFDSRMPEEGKETPIRTNSTPTPSSTGRSRASSFRFWGSSSATTAAATTSAANQPSSNPTPSARAPAQPSASSVPTPVLQASSTYPSKSGIVHSPPTGPAATPSNPVTVTTHLNAMQVPSVFQSLTSARSFTNLRQVAASQSTSTAAVTNPASAGSESSGTANVSNQVLHPGAFTNVLLEEIWAAPEDFQTELSCFCTSPESVGGSSAATGLGTLIAAQAQKENSGQRQGFSKHFYGIGVRRPGSTSSTMSNAAVRKGSNTGSITGDSPRESAKSALPPLQIEASSGSAAAVPSTTSSDPSSGATSTTSGASTLLNANGSRHGDGLAASPSPVSFASASSFNESPHADADVKTDGATDCESDLKGIAEAEADDKLSAEKTFNPRVRGHVKEETTDSEIEEMMAGVIGGFNGVAKMPSKGAKIVQAVRAQKQSKKDVVRPGGQTKSPPKAKAQGGKRQVSVEDADESDEPDHEEIDVDDDEDDDAEEDKDLGEDSAGGEDEQDEDQQEDDIEGTGSNDDEDDDEDEEDEEEEPPKAKKPLHSKAAKSGKTTEVKPTKVISIVNNEDGEKLKTHNGFIVLPITMPPLRLFPPQNGFRRINEAFTKTDADSQVTLVPVTHQLFFRLHNTKASDADRFPKGRTLFICNVPVDASARHFRRIFRRCGPIERVIFAKRERNPYVGPAGGSAHVIFFEEEAAQRALAMRARKRVWSAELEDEETPTQGEGEAPYLGQGLKKYEAYYEMSHPPVKVLEREVNAAMEKFEEMEQERERELERRRNQPDEDGFILVTKGAGRKGKAANESKRNRKAKKKEVVDFYRFQMREAKRTELSEMRRKFEEDKARIAAMKAQRKFRPY
ncbi:hypothetical protein HDU96_007360 [Phlyctochytrium bullatum]|nr:hypothetical protein HDU96_007360 [Phlyctochytrium bullatum]